MCLCPGTFRGIVICEHRYKVFRVMSDLAQERAWYPDNEIAQACFEAMQCGVDVGEIEVPERHYREEKADGSVTTWSDDIQVRDLLDRFDLQWILDTPKRRVAILLACHYKQVRVRPLPLDVCHRIVMFL